LNTRTPRIIHGVPGPSGEPGVLLLVPPSEALDWDLKDEVASTARHWMADRQAWWVAAPYASTATAIVTRVHGHYLVSEGVGRPEQAGWRLQPPRPARALGKLARLVVLRLRVLMQRLRDRRGAGTL
jgi:hypothetical protein